MSKYIVYLALPLLLIVLLLLLRSRDNQPTPEPRAGETVPVPISEQPAPQGVSIETYVREHIAELSPEPEVLGGSFYVTAIEAHDGKGTVSYEDGHNAYTADFTYEIAASGNPKVTSFTVR